MLPRLILNTLVASLVLFSRMATICAAAESAEKIEVLILTGGHGFEREPFFDMFQQMPEIRFEEVVQGKTATAYERADLREFAVVLLFDMKQDITDEQKEAFVSLTEHGTGFVVMHHALVSYQDWRDYEQIVGGRYPEQQDQRGKVSTELGYRHDVDIPTQVVAKDHPVTAGLSDFLVRDEIYWGFRVAPDVTPLLRTTHPESGNPLAWAHEVNKSRVVTIQLGDSPSAYTNSNFWRLVAQSIRWVARR